MKKENLNISDEQFRKLLSGTQEKASENLKFRIIQQIETEKSLTRKKTKNSDSVFANMLPIFGVMYALIAIVIGGVYYTSGQDAILSTNVLMTIIAITSICSIFWLVSVYDDKRRNKRKS